MSRPSAMPWFEAIRNGNVVTIDGPNGKLTAEDPILATTYWNPETVKVSQLLDTQNGRVFAIKTTKVATPSAGRLPCFMWPPWFQGPR